MGRLSFDDHPKWPEGETEIALAIIAGNAVFVGLILTSEDNVALKLGQTEEDDNGFEEGTYKRIGWFRGEASARLEKKLEQLESAMQSDTFNDIDWSVSEHHLKWKMTTLVLVLE